MKLVAGALITATLVTSPLQAAPVTYAFDTVTAAEMHNSVPSVTGLAKDTLAPLTVSFLDDQQTLPFKFQLNRCVPLIVTAMEKPGRYYLYLTVNTALPNVHLQSCKLEIKP